MGHICFPLDGVGEFGRRSNAPVTDEHCDDGRVVGRHHHHRVELAAVLSKKIGRVLGEFFFLGVPEEIAARPAVVILFPAPIEDGVDEVVVDAALYATQKGVF